LAPEANDAGLAAFWASLMVAGPFIREPERIGFWTENKPHKLAAWRGGRRATKTDGREKKREGKNVEREGGRRYRRRKQDREEGLRPQKCL